MLYETLLQPKLMVIFLILGFVCGFVFDVGNFIKFLFANKKVSNFLLDFLQTSLCLFLLFLVNLKVNFGQIRLFPAVLVLICFTIHRLTLGKIIAKLYISCYNKLQKLISLPWRKNKDAKTNKND